MNDLKFLLYSLTNNTYIRVILSIRLPATAIHVHGKIPWWGQTSLDSAVLNLSSSHQQETCRICLAHHPGSTYTEAGLVVTYMSMGYFFSNGW